MKIEVDMNSEDIRNLINSIHDSYYDLTGDSIEDVKSLILAGQLPPSILFNVAQWGVGDTEVRDDIYLWLKEGIEKGE